MDVLSGGEKQRMAVSFHNCVLSPEPFTPLSSSLPDGSAVLP